MRAPTAVVRDAFSALGLHLARRRNLPYGVVWQDDVVSLGVPLRVVFDVGANKGQTAQRLVQALPGTSRIYSFEPVPAAFEYLQQNTRALPNVEAVPVALGSVDGTAHITADAASGQNTLLVDARPGARTVEVPIRRLDTVMSERGLQYLDLLKIDVEGHELAVLDGAVQTLSSGAIRMIFVEVEFNARPGEPHANFFAIHDRLRPLGYNVVSFYTGGIDREGWRWGNALFARDVPVAHVRCSPYAGA